MEDPAATGEEIQRGTQIISAREAVMKRTNDQLAAIGTQRGMEAWLIGLALLMGLFGATIWMLSLTGPLQKKGRMTRWIHRFLRS